MEVRELSIGDYVLNGGEVAALAMIEAVVRLLPGFMGNAESLEEESLRRRAAGVPRLHQARHLARPRGARGAALRRPRPDRRVAPRPVRTTYRRAPPRPGPRLPGGRPRRPAPPRSRWPLPSDAAELFTLQRACWVQEQQANPETTSRRCTRTSPTSRRGWGSGRRSCCAAAAGSSVPCAVAWPGTPGTSAG